MSEIVDPAKVDETKLDGYKKIGAIVVGALGTLCLFAVKDPAQQAVVNQTMTMVQNLIPVGAGVIYAAIQGVVDVIKVQSVGKVAVEQAIYATPVTVTAVSDGTFINPHPEPKPVSQLDSFKVVPMVQLNPDKPNIATANLSAMEKLVSSDEGAFEYLIGTIADTIDREYKAWIDKSLQPLDALQKVVSTYLGVNLTPMDCEAINAEKNLAAILHSYADKTIVAGIYTAHKAGTLGKGVWEGCMIRALYYARKNVVDSLMRKLNSDDIALVREGMGDMGLNEYTQRTAQSEGASWRVWLHGGFILLNPAAELGLNPETYLPV